MTWATIAREIARLDQIGQTRALDHGETIQLDKLIRMERRYGRMAERRAAGSAAPIAGAPVVPAIAGRPTPPVGARVRFTCPTGAGPKTYEATVTGYRANRGGPAGWVETVDDAGFTRSVQPARCAVVGQAETADGAGTGHAPAVEGAPVTAGAPGQRSSLSQERSDA